MVKIILIRSRRINRNDVNNANGSHKIFVSGMKNHPPMILLIVLNIFFEERAADTFPTNCFFLLRRAIKRSGSNDSVRIMEICSISFNNDKS